MINDKNDKDISKKNIFEASYYYIPQVFEQSHRGERVYDLYSRLLKDRIIFLQSEINDIVSNLIIGQLLLLEAEDPGLDVYIYINSPGGSVTAGLGIYDTIQYIKPDVHTICIGQASSMAALLLASGTEGKRCALPHSRIIMHQPLGGAMGQATDIEIQANELLRIRHLVNDLFVKHTHQNLEQIEKDTDRDFFMDPQQALNYGIIDKIFYTHDSNDVDKKLKLGN